MSWPVADVGALLDDLDLTRRQGGLLVAAAATTAAWMLAGAAVWLARRPHEPHVETPTLELGPEPPALANMLARGFRVDADAVPATLLDLAARGIVEIERIDVEKYQCRLEHADPGPLEPYERRVLDLLRSRASDGVVPAQALTTGPSEASKRWWRSFRGEVVADAQRRGLSRDIWDRRLIQALALVAALPTLLVGLGFGFDAGAGYAVGVAFVLGGIYSRHPQRDTPAGLAAATHWAAVREQLEQDEAFPAQPPIAVVLWERLLAYGAALGVAAGAIRPIPMGAESDRRAWSAYGGRWHQVDIRYPRLFPPLWGMHPAGALLGGVLFTGIAGFFLYVVHAVASSVDDPGSRAALVFGLLYALGSLVAVGAVAVAVRGLGDLWTTREVTGEILRLRERGSDDRRRYYVALDDGASRRVRAWQVRSELYGPLEQSQVVTATVTPRLGYVRSIVAAAAPGGRAEVPSRTWSG